MINQCTDLHQLHDYMKALIILSPDDKPIYMYINGTALFSSEKSIRVQYHCDYLSKETCIIQNHYENLCSFVLEQCQLLFPDIDIIFDDPTHVHHLLLMEVSNQLFSNFVDSILQDLYTKNSEEYCPMLMYFYKTTSNTFESILNINKQQSSSIYLDEIFMKHQKLYGQFESHQLKDKLTSLMNPSLEKLESVFKQSKLLIFFKKSEDIINPFKAFNNEIPNEILSESTKSLIRCNILSPSEQLSNNLTDLISIFIEDFLNKYLILSIKSCSFFIPQIKKMENFGNFLNLINLINSDIHSLEDTYNNTLKDVLKPVRGHFINMKDQLIVNIEKETNIGLQNCIDLVTIHAETALNMKQKKQDYLPITQSNNDNSFMNLIKKQFGKNKDSLSPNDSSSSIIDTQKTTEACRLLCLIIKKIINDVNAHFSGEKKEMFLSQLGKNLFKAIVDHLCKYKYDFQGCKVLVIDVAEYQSTFELFGIESVSKKLMDLAKTALLMSTKVENLKDVISNQPLTKRAIKLSKRMLPLRIDSNNIELNSLF